MRDQAWSDSDETPSPSGPSGCAYGFGGHVRVQKQRLLDELAIYRLANSSLGQHSGLTRWR